MYQQDTVNMTALTIGSCTSQDAQQETAAMMPALQWQYAATAPLISPESILEHSEEKLHRQSNGLNTSLIAAMCIVVIGIVLTLLAVDTMLPRTTWLWVVLAVFGLGSLCLLLSVRD